MRHYSSGQTGPNLQKIFNPHPLHYFQKFLLKLKISQRNFVGNWANLAIESGDTDLMKLKSFLVEQRRVPFNEEKFYSDIKEKFYSDIK